jgi:hypothetical protein
LKHKSKVVIDKALEESWRELLEEGLTKSEAKIQMAGVRRFIKYWRHSLDGTVCHTSSKDYQAGMPKLRG